MDAINAFHMFLQNEMNYIIGWSKNKTKQKKAVLVNQIMKHDHNFKWKLTCLLSE